MVFYLIFLALIIYLFIVFKRAKKYKYDTSKDYMYSLDKNFIAELPIKDDTVFLPNNSTDFDSLFLKINLSPALISYFFKPHIDIQGTKHYFEYGAKGTRYLNISNLSELSLKLTLKNLNLSDKKVSLYGYKNNIDISKKILILAPHADDAEIAAFGLYKNAENVTIITTTIGENGVCKYCDIYKDQTTASIKKAELRVSDAFAAALFGNVDIKNSLTLGYFGNSLKWMCENQDKEASSLINEFGNMNKYRKVSHSNIKLPSYVKPIYSSFLNDLTEILLQLQPNYIITPHPNIDSHTDHIYTTNTLLKALSNTNFSCKLLTYTNHLTLSETYPLGNIYSPITLPPNFKNFYFDSIYSYNLDKNLQTDKFLALEAIHDLRDSLVFLSIGRAYRHLAKMIIRKFTSKDKTYFKRAIRANELFFVIDSKNIEKLQQGN